MKKHTMQFVTFALYSIIAACFGSWLVIRNGATDLNVFIVVVMLLLIQIAVSSGATFRINQMYFESLSLSVHAAHGETLTIMLKIARQIDEHPEMLDGLVTALREAMDSLSIPLLVYIEPAVNRIEDAKGRDAHEKMLAAVKKVKEEGIW